MPHCKLCRHHIDIKAEFSHHDMVRKFNRVAYDDWEIMHTHNTLGYVCGYKSYHLAMDLDPVWHRVTLHVTNDLTVLNYWEQCPHYRKPNLFDKLKLRYIEWRDRKEKEWTKNHPNSGTEDPGPF